MFSKAWFLHQNPEMSSFSFFEKNNYNCSHSKQKFMAVGDNFQPIFWNTACLIMQTQMTTAAKNMKILPENIFPIMVMSSLRDLNNYSFPFHKTERSQPWKLLYIPSNS